MIDRNTMVRFKALFETERDRLLFSKKVVNESYYLQQDDLMDEADTTSSELEASMQMRLRSREMLLLKKIDEALERISEGSFGACESCEEDIGLKRLEARPTATMCVHCKEQDERREHLHIDGWQPKSLGRRLRLA